MASGWWVGGGEMKGRQSNQAHQGGTLIDIKRQKDGKKTKIEGERE